MASPFRHFRRPAPPRRPARARLALEPLEERAVPATIFTVNTLTDENNPADGLLSLREAITTANALADADVIVFAAGLTGTITLTLPGADDTNAGGDLDIRGPVSITGPGANKLTVNGGGIDRVFDVVTGQVAAAAGAAVSISGLTITGGVTDRGGGVRVSNYPGQSLTLSGVEITGNQAIGRHGSGGGVYVALGSVVTIANSTIAGNSASVEGGGVAAPGSTLNLDQSTVSGNSAASVGGGIFLAGDPLSNSPAFANVRNSTITANTTANSAGGGIYIVGATTTLTSTIVAGNTGSGGVNDISGTVEASSDHNLIGDGTGLAGITNGVNGSLVGTAATPVNPLLGPLQFNGGTTRTHALLAGSSALNAGSNPAGLAVDQRGSPFLRAFGGGVDIGAFELIVQAAQPPGGQAVQAAVTLLNSFKSAGVRLAAFAFGELNGDFVNDLILAVRLRNNRIVMLTFDGRDGHIVGLFVPFSTPASPSARVQLVLVNLNSDPALEIGLIVTPSGGGVPHISAFTGTGMHIL
jgi:CSLREA domain-containing protein